MPYLWRRLTPEQRASLLAWRKQRSFPWHSPLHALGGKGTYHLTAACLDHAPHVGRSPERMDAFCGALLAAIRPVTTGLHAWCVLPNHYHLLVSVPDLRRCSSVTMTGFARSARMTTTRAIGSIHLGISPW